MIENKKALLEKIDSLAIYKNDQKIIFQLMKTVSPAMFTKILEEVINGNLYWSDFEKFLANTDYPNQLRQSLASQKEIETYLKKLVAFRTEINEFLNIDSAENLVAAVDTPSVSKNIDDIYASEKEKYQENLLYELTKVNKNDSFLQLAVKLRLFNAIRNGEILKKKIETNSLGNTEYSDGTITSDNKIFEYIDANDIFYFISDYYIPIAYNFQVLDSFDREFASQNHLSEEQMKQFKSLSVMFKRNRIYNSLPISDPQAISDAIEASEQTLSELSSGEDAE